MELGAPDAERPAGARARRGLGTLSWTSTWRSPPSDRPPRRPSLPASYIPREKRDHGDRPRHRARRTWRACSRGATWSRARLRDRRHRGGQAGRPLDRQVPEGASPCTRRRRGKPQRLTDAEVADLTASIAQAARVPARRSRPEARISRFPRGGPRIRDLLRRQAEASRCLASQIEGCIECGECERRCDVKAIDYRMEDEIVERPLRRHRPRARVRPLRSDRKGRIRLRHAGQG